MENEKLSSSVYEIVKNDTDELVVLFKSKSFSKATSIVTRRHPFTDHSFPSSPDNVPRY